MSSGFALIKIRPVIALVGSGRLARRQRSRVRARGMPLRSGGRINHKLKILLGLLSLVESRLNNAPIKAPLLVRVRLVASPPFFFLPSSLDSIAYFRELLATNQNIDEGPAQTRSRSSSESARFICRQPQRTLLITRLNGVGCGFDPHRPYQKSR